MWEINNIVKVCGHFQGQRRIVRSGLVEVLDRRIIASNNKVYYDIGYREEDVFLRDGPRRENNVSSDFLCADPLGRRSLRREIASTVDRTDVQLLFDRIQENCPSICILRAKQYLDSTTNESVLERMFTLLERNTSTQAVYLQNLENGMTDHTLKLLLALLRRNARIWAVNVGENFKISKRGWEDFAAALPGTSVTHLYAGSESTVHGALKVKMRDAIRGNRGKHNWHCSQQNAHVIQKIGQMWWNPKNSAVFKQQHNSQVPWRAGSVLALRRPATAARGTTADWQFAVVREVGADTLLHRLAFPGMEEEEDEAVGPIPWTNLLTVGAAASAAMEEEEEAQWDEVDAAFTLGLAFHARAGAWWPALHFAKSGLLVFLHCAEEEEEEDVRFEPCGVREADYVLPFEYRGHELVRDGGGGDADRWHRAVAAAADRFPAAATGAAKRSE